MQLWHFRRVVYGRQNEFGLNQGGKQMLRKGTFKFNQDANFNFQLNRAVIGPAALFKRRRCRQPLQYGKYEACP